jgi:hypothetical protein
MKLISDHKIYLDNNLPFLAHSLYGIRSSLLSARQHLAISLTTSVTLALGDLFRISARFWNNIKK